MTLTEAISILRQYNQWRRGAEIPQPQPSEIGIAIDMVLAYIQLNQAGICTGDIEILETANKSKNTNPGCNTVDLLINFQLHLNNKGLITNHDWDFEKEAKRFIRKNKSK